MNNKQKFMLMLVIPSVALYVLLTIVAIKEGGVIWSIPVAWLASPILFLVLAFLFEKSSIASGGRGNSAREVVGSVFSLEKQAWSFIFGDIFILPLAFAVAADKWSQTIDRSGLSLTWWVSCLLVGFLFGIGFHYKVEKPGYTNAGVAASLNSPTKLFHDFVSRPVLSGGLLFVFGPLLVTPQWQWQLNGHTAAIILLVACWTVLGGVFDAKRAQTLLPWGHPPFDMDELSGFAKELNK